eukprot:TRINITY_DN985_c0_g3_i1.p1 TRINITY_DN985_c0_g3~~TRINITY_DN985_c0_g3_i1.p1  ORF type:complete len:810 (-),score=140.71 TRINITY_DN985_c0_g3_i1:412-2841(-)
MNSHRHRRNKSQQESNPLSSSTFVRGPQNGAPSPLSLPPHPNGSSHTTTSPTAATAQLVMANPALHPALHPPSHAASQSTSNISSHSITHPASISQSPFAPTMNQHSSSSSVSSSSASTPFTPHATLSSIGFSASQTNISSAALLSATATPTLGPNASASQVATPASRFFSASVLRNLGDRLYERRKLAAMEIETTVMQLAYAKDFDAIHEVIIFLNAEYTFSKNPQNRKGGLIGLAGCSIGLGPEDIGIFCLDLCEAILKSLDDEDSKVRYYACEAMYNLAKVSRSKIMPMFHDIFERLCNLSSDTDVNVKNGAQLLDRLMKDIVTESENFEIHEFIPLIKDRILLTNPLIRQFLVAWIITLDSVPDIDMLEFLPDLLEGLFLMLSDQNKEIKRQADSALSEFLREIKKSGDVEFGKMVLVLIGKCTSKDEFTKLTALVWCREFIILGKDKLLFHGPDMITAILAPISRGIEEIRDAANAANVELMKLFFGTKQKYDFTPLIRSLLSQLEEEYVQTKISVLHWFMMLHERSPEDLASRMDMFFCILVERLGDIADEVVRLNLEVLCRISSREPYLSQFVTAVITFFRTNPALLRSRGNIIIERIAVTIDQETIFRLFSAKLENETDYAFAANMSQTLHVIILTSPELYELRTKVKNFFTLQNRELFTILYKSCCHSPVSVFSLCLLGQAYEHACTLLSKFAEFEVTLDFLLELDKLIMLLETPVFSYIRLQLLEPSRHPNLYKCLYGVLMMIPQSSAFEILKARLTSMAGVGAFHILPASATKQRLAKQVSHYLITSHKYSFLLFNTP